MEKMREKDRAILARFDFLKSSSRPGSLPSIFVAYWLVGWTERYFQDLPRGLAVVGRIGESMLEGVGNDPVADMGPRRCEVSLERKPVPTFPLTGWGLRRWVFAPVMSVIPVKGRCAPSSVTPAAFLGFMSRREIFTDRQDLS